MSKNTVTGTAPVFAVSEAKGDRLDFPAEQLVTDYNVGDEIVVYHNKFNIFLTGAITGRNSKIIYYTASYPEYKQGRPTGFWTELEHVSRITKLHKVLK